MDRLREWWLSLALTLVAVAAALIPVAGVRLQFDRAAVARGEVWRVVTGHFVHWSPDHAFWDILVFAVLGPLVERRNRRRFIAFLIAAALAIPAAIVAFEPRITTYRGLSGLDTGLFTMLVVGLFLESWRQGDRRRCLVLAGAGLALAGKTLYELFTGDTLFVRSREAQFVPLVSSHVVGAVIAGLVSVSEWRRGG